MPPSEVHLIVRNWFVYIIYYNYNSLQQGNMRELQPRSWKALWVPMLFFTRQLQGIWCWTPEARALPPSLHPVVGRELKTIDIHKGAKELQIKFPNHMMIVLIDITNYKINIAIYYNIHYIVQDRNKTSQSLLTPPRPITLRWVQIVSCCPAKSCQVLANGPGLRWWLARHTYIWESF